MLLEDYLNQMFWLGITLVRNVGVDLKTLLIGGWGNLIIGQDITNFYGGFVVLLSPVILIDLTRLRVLTLQW